MDEVYGFGGNDYVDGGDGDDRIYGDGGSASGDDLLIGGGGSDILIGDGGSDRLYATRLVDLDQAIADRTTTAESGEGRLARRRRR